MNWLHGWLHRRCRRDYAELVGVAKSYRDEITDARADIQRLRQEVADAEALRGDAEAHLARLQDRYNLDAWRIQAANQMASDRTRMQDIQDRQQRWIEQLERENARLRGERLTAEARHRGGLDGGTAA